LGTHLFAEDALGHVGQKRVGGEHGVWRLHAELGREVVQLLQLVLHQVLHALHLRVLHQACIMLKSDILLRICR
jgi:hypothetical protein